MNERTQLRLDALFECHNVRHNSIIKAMRAVQRAINENPIYSELEHAKSNLNLALIRENIDYENHKKLIESEDKNL